MHIITLREIVGLLFAGGLVTFTAIICVIGKKDA